MNCPHNFNDTFQEPFEPNFGEGPSIGPPNADTLPPWIMNGDCPIGPLGEDDIAWLLSFNTSDLVAEDLGSPALGRHSLRPSDNIPSITACNQIKSISTSQLPSLSSQRSEDEENKDQNTATIAKAFQCTICKRSFSHKVRAQVCENRHRGIKGYQCKGDCGDLNCTKEYGSSTSLSRHCLPQDKRYAVCEICGMRYTKQNVTNHRRKCSVSSTK